MNRFSFFFVTVLLLLTSLANAENRFLALPVIRCTPPEDAGLDKQFCNQDIKARFEMKQINKEEMEFLIAKGAVPTMSALNKPIGYCFCGCFAPWTRISVSKGANLAVEMLPIIDVWHDRDYIQVVSLADGSTLENLNFKTAKITNMVSGPEAKPLVVIRTGQGKELSVTSEHAILISTGKMITAKEIRKGDFLVTDIGTLDEVSEISRRQIKEDTINLMADGKGLLSHLILAENLVVGDLAWQNSLQEEIDAILLRK